MPRATPRRGIDSRTYYMVDTSQYVQLINLSGCGNTGAWRTPAACRVLLQHRRRCA
jgi:isoamylase